MTNRNNPIFLMISVNLFIDAPFCTHINLKGHFLNENAPLQSLFDLVYDIADLIFYLVDVLLGSHLAY
jgi:hypothetical protein